MKNGRGDEGEIHLHVPGRIPGNGGIDGDGVDLYFGEAGIPFCLTGGELLGSGAGITLGFNGSEFLGSGTGVAFCFNYIVARLSGACIAFCFNGGELLGSGSLGESIQIRKTHAHSEAIPVGAKTTKRAKSLNRH